MHQKEDAEHKPPSYWHKERILNLSQTLKKIYFSILEDCSHLYCCLFVTFKKEKIKEYLSLILAWDRLD